MKYLISSLAVALLLAGSLPAVAADAPAADAAGAKTHTMKKAHHAKTHGAPMEHHQSMKKGKMDKKSPSPDHSADSLNAEELQKLQAGK
jgi:hypothetical protein